MPDTRTSALRRLLADVASMASDDSLEASADRAAAAVLALLRADASSDTLRNLAARVQDLARQARGRRGPAVRTQIDSLVREVSALVAASLPTGPRNAPLVETGLLEGALRDAVRQAGRRP
jgi:hypothetical protein